LQVSPGQGERLALLGDLFVSFPSGNRLENLQAALSTYQAALQANPKDGQPAQRAEIQRRLAESLCELFAWTGEEHYALQAEDAISQALAYFQPRQAQPECSILLSDLAHLYARRSRLEKDASLAHKAIETYQQALQNTSRTEASFEWAAIHQEMGRLEQELFSATGEEQCRTDALRHLQAALQVFTPELFPHHHAEAQRCLAALEDEPGVP
jgi:tetratricopeptide (TPR) repeat protein